MKIYDKSKFLLKMWINWDVIYFNVSLMQFGTYYEQFPLTLCYQRFNIQNIPSLNSENAALYF